MVLVIADPKRHDCIRKNTKNAGLKKGTSAGGIFVLKI
jgi:hypothetical protein